MTDIALQAAPASKARGYWATVGRRITRDKVSMVCAFILIAIFLSALCAPWLGLADPRPVDPLSLAFFSDALFNSTCQQVFDLFNLDGILGDKFLVNGTIQPFFEVKPRRYRFRLLDTGPSRFFEFFLTDLNNLSATNQFWVIANDGNLLPAPVKVS